MVLQKKKKIFKELSLADWITLFNAFCGISSILFCLNYLGNDRKLPYLFMSFCCFPLSLIADIMDGRVARYRSKYGGMSMYGSDLDSLSDAISFGVAPSVLAFTLGMTGMWDGFCLVFNSCCGVARLARYNATQEEMTDKKLGKVTHFEGLPIPGNLICVVLLALDTYFLNSFLANTFKIRILGKHFHPFSIVHVIFGFLMVSTVKIPKY